MNPRDWGSCIIHNWYDLNFEFLLLTLLLFTSQSWTEVSISYSQFSLHTFVEVGRFWKILSLARMSSCLKKMKKLLNWKNNLKKLKRTSQRMMWSQWFRDWCHYSATSYSSQHTSKHSQSNHHSHHLCCANIHSSQRCACISHISWIPHTWLSILIPYHIIQHCLTLTV